MKIKIRTVRVTPDSSQPNCYVLKIKLSANGIGYESLMTFTMKELNKFFDKATSIKVEKLTGTLKIKPMNLHFDFKKWLLTQLEKDIKRKKRSRTIPYKGKQMMVELPETVTGQPELKIT